LYCIPEDNDEINKYNIWKTDQYSPNPNRRGWEELKQILTTSKIIMDSAPHQSKNRRISRDIRHQVNNIRNKNHHILLMKKMKPFFQPNERGCMIYRRILNRYPYRQQEATPAHSNAWIETRNGHSYSENSKGDNNWFDNFCSELQRTKEIQRRIARQFAGSRILSSTSSNQVCT
jgi:hypothetical protein